jgi:tRNA A-37 threonylcarbamoyl transferase component Bud32
MNSEVSAPRSVSAPTLSAGQVVAETYQIVRRIGAGGMGEIYEATHLRLAGRYAIKLLRPEIATTPEALARFKREAMVTSALRHPNIVQVVDFSALDSGAPFLVMEFLDGLELAKVIAAGPLPLSRVVLLVKQIASGLTAAHESHVVHRDLKPQNIFVLEVVGHEQALIKIVDFGISKVRDLATNLTTKATVMGTVQYMSPEQALGAIDDIDGKTDQFALAAIVLEMLTGHDAFAGDSATSILYQIVHEEPRGLVDPHGPIPGPVRAVLRRALAKDKHERFPTVMAFSTALEAAASAGAEALTDTLAAKRSALDATGAPARAGERSTRKRLLAAGLIALGIGGAWFLLRPPRGNSLAPAPREIVPAAREARQEAPPVVPAPATIAGPAPAKMPAATEPLVAAAKAPGRPREATNKTTHRPAREGARAPGAPPPAGAIPVPTSCDPNFYFDDQGNKHFKPECFLNQPARP